MLNLDFKTIGLKIRERRISVKMTQEFLAEKVGVNPSHICNIENGNANPSLTTIVNIANALECSVDLFIYNEYNFSQSDDVTSDTDALIIEKLRYYDSEKKLKFLKILDLI